MAQRSLKVKPELLETVKLALRSSGGRQADLALELALSRTVVSKFFNGYPVSSSSFQEICQKLRLSWKEIADLSNADHVNEINLGLGFGIDFQGDLENHGNNTSSRLNYILHLSDLHFGTTDDARIWYAQLAEDLRYELHCSHLDALIISGDIASKSTPDEYAAAHLFINRLSQEFQLESQQIIIVPGNHDVNWQLSEAAYSRISVGNSQEGTEEFLTDENGEFIEGVDGEQHKQRFINFSRFYEAIKGELYPLEYEQQYTLQHLQEQNLLILGLNSAWQIDHHNKYSVSINVEAVSNALSLIRRNPAYEHCLKIAVWHHPLNSIFGDRITDTGVMERLAAAEFRLVLHGGIHRDENNSYRYEYSTGGQQINIIGAGVFGASVQESDSSYLWQYNFIKIETSKVTVETRRRDEPNGVWKPDARWNLTSELNPLPHYVIPLTQDHADDPKIYVELGNAHAESGRYQEAIASYDKAIEIHPDFYEAWLNRGEALFNLGIYEEFNFVRYEEAIASHNRAIKINPDCYQAWFNRGEALTKIMELEEAITSYEKTIKINPDCYQAWFKKGLLLSESGRFEAAIASYDKTIKIKPEHWQAWFNQGVLLSKLERFEAAIASYDKTIEISPNFYEAWFNRGLSLFYLGQYDQALTSYDKVIEIKPDCVEAWNSRGITLATLKQYEQALVSYDKVIEIKPDSVEGWNSRGLILVSLGQFEEAIASFDKAIELKLDFHQAWHNRGIAARKSASCDQFLAFSSAIVRQNPALNQRGYAGELASYQEGLKYCQQTTHPEDWGILHQALGDAHYLQGKGKSNYWEYWHKAITEYYQTLITLTPEAFPELYLEVVQSLIRALFGLEQIHEAEELKQRGLDVLRHLLSSSLSEQKKQHLTQKFSNFNQLAAITLEKVDIDYDILLNISSETILIGEEYEFTVFVNPHTLDKGNRYLLEIPQNEAIGNELNIFLTTPGFQFNGDNTTSLPLDPDTTNINQTATFNLTALRPGKTKIKAELYCGDTYKTTLETEVEVTAFKETELRPLIAARSRPVPQPDIILQVRTAWKADISACTLNFHIDSYQPRLLFADDVDYNSQSLSATWVERYSEGVASRSHSILKTTLEEAASSLPGDFHSRLVSLGQYLFQSLLPEELQNTFRTIASLNHPFTLLILADQDAWFPWELLHDGQKFLGDRLIIGRWLWELEKARPYEFPVGAVNVAHYASVEQPELWTELLHSSGAPPPIPMQAGVFNDMTLFESIRGLHLIRYGQYVDTTNRQDAPVRVNSSSNIEDIEREVQPAKLSLRRNHPLVSLSYLNAGQPELTALEQTWASTFVRAGCSAFVGSLWAVQPNVEAAFISAFYHSIWAGQTLGVAFQTARRLAKTVVPESLDWLAYVLFGDPMARPYRPVQGQGYAVVEPIGQEIDDPVPPGSTVRFRVSLRRTPPVWYENRLMEVAEDLIFDDLRIFIVTSGLQVTPDDSIVMTRTATGDYLGWFALTVPAEMETRSVLVQVYFEDGIEPVHNLRFALNIVKRDGEVQ